MKPTWAEYVRNVIGDNARGVDVAERTGIDPATISRWLRGETRSITSLSVRRFARGYERPLLEAFVIAGFLSDAEAGMTFTDYPDLSRVSSEALLREIADRMNGDGTHADSDGAVAPFREQGVDGS